jgi:hypothetical protein
MDRAALTRIVLLVAALLLVATPQASAARGSLVAKELVYDAPVDQEGRLVLATVTDAGSDPTAAQVGTGAHPWLDVRAASAQALHFEHGVEVVGDPPVYTAADPSPPEPQTTDLQDGRIRIASFQPGFEINLYTLSGDLAYSTQTTGGRLQSQDVAMGSGGLGKPQEVTGQAPTDGHPTFFGFAHVDPKATLVVQDRLAPGFSFTVKGDFIVELRGLTVTAQDARTNVTLDSGVWHEPLAGTPAATQAAAYHEREAFLRIFLSGATLEFANEGGAPAVGLAAAQASTHAEGAVTFTSAKGHISASGQDAVLDGQRYVLPGPSIVDARPSGGDLALAVSQPAHLGTRGTIASVPAPASAALIGTGAILALATAVGIGLLRRVLGLPALADVETAIEEADYRKAARLAGRILTRLPGSEDALLGRAIALSKSGEPQRVVDELSAHLAARPASDGSLHYVLGLAQLEVGHDDAGKASLREAVRLTPSLHAEVAPRLGKAFSVAPTTTKDVHGYA